MMQTRRTWLVGVAQGGAAALALAALPAATAAAATPETPAPWPALPRSVAELGAQLDLALGRIRAGALARLEDPAAAIAADPLEAWRSVVFIGVALGALSVPVGLSNELREAGIEPAPWLGADQIAAARAVGAGAR